MTQTTPYQQGEVKHRYGEKIHILDHPYLTSLLAILCSVKTRQPTFNVLIDKIYEVFVAYVASAVIPQIDVAMPTRMIKTNTKGVFRGKILDPKIRVAIVDIARAGIRPSQICYDALNWLLRALGVRQDHLVMARTTNDAHQVTGASIHGSKIGGKFRGRIVIIPDPMGATGGSLATAIKSMIATHGKPKLIVTMNLIITPEFIQRMKALELEIGVTIIVYAIRLDRGMSHPLALESVPGTYPTILEAGEDEVVESGLDERQYIVPGGGGFGELMNNSWV